LFKWPKVKAPLRRVAVRTKAAVSEWKTAAKDATLQVAERTSEAAKASECLSPTLASTTRGYAEKAAGTLGEVSTALRRQALGLGEPEGMLARQMKAQQC